MKITKFLIALMLLVSMLSACLDDISELDPRDAIAKEWRVTETGSGRVYTAKILKDDVNPSKIYIDNFHDLGSTDKLSATVVGKSITIPNQKLDNIDNFTNASGTISSDSETIVFTYKWDDGNAAPKQFQVTFGEIIVKKKAATPVAVQ